MGKKYGYARVSTSKQELGRQIKALMDFGIKKEDIFVDKFTGKSYDRDGFKKLCSIVKAGDTVVAEELNRVGRTSKELLAILENWEKQGIVFISLKENIDLSTPTGKLITQLLSCLSEFEASCIRQRVIEGLAIAKLNGRFGGRPKIAPDKISKAIALYNTHTHSVKEVCKICGISTTSLYRALKGVDKNEKSGDVL